MPGSQRGPAPGDCPPARLTISARYGRSVVVTAELYAGMPKLLITARVRRINSKALRRWVIQIISNNRVLRR
jgi:hypothetical protein